MTIYIDDDYKCHVSNADGRRAVETNFFNGKCTEWIESYRFVPEGETWMRDGSHYLRTEMSISSDKDVRMDNIKPMIYAVDNSKAKSAPVVVGNTRGAVLL